MANVIKQIVRGDGDMQTIKMVVRDNERGPQGIQGPRGISGMPGPVGPRGADGAIQYQAGMGIAISADNVITATGDATAAWGGLHGNIQMQTDLQEEFGEYTKTANLAAVALSNSYTDLDNQPVMPVVNDATLTIAQNGTTKATFTANSSSNAYANITAPIITMTTTDPGEGSDLASNNYIGVYGDEPMILDYSTNEVDTGAKWINGDNIYKKTVNIGTLPNNTTSTTAHNITGFSYLVKLEGNFTNGTNSAPIPYCAPTASKSVQAYVDATNITIGTGEDRSAYSGYVTLYYTKSS